MPLWFPLEFKFTFNEPLQNVVNEQCGHYHRQRRDWDAAGKEYDKVFVHNPEHVDAGVGKSLVYSELGDVVKANQFAKEFFHIEEVVPDKVNLRYANTLYDLNEFEFSLGQTHNSLDVTSSALYDSELQKHADSVTLNLNDTVDLKAGPCLATKRKIIEKIQEADARRVIDKRPIWKIFKENDECDVLSIKDLHIKVEPKLLKHKKSQNEIFLNQVYLGLKPSMEVTFIKQLLHDKRFSISQSQRSDELRELAVNAYEKSKGWREMLHNRRPIYTRNFQNPELGSLHRTQLFREQYKTRRQVFDQLDKAKQLAADGNLSKLLTFVENIMANYYTIKPRRIFPRKFEFINEMYNIVGLTYARSLTIPPDIKKHNLDEQLWLLLQIPIEDKEKVIIQVFGDKATYRDPTAPNYEFVRLKNSCDIFEKRSEFVEYAVEHCYLYHERAGLSLKMNKLEETRILGNKIVQDYGESCQNWVWKFLGSLMLVRANTVQTNIERNVEEVELCVEFAEHLDERTRHFVQILKETIKGLYKRKLAQEQI